MSEIRTIMILCRTYSRKVPLRKDPLAGIRKRIQLMDHDESVDSFDAEDVSEFEADFMNVGISHKMHEREMRIRKERLKQQIVTQKYFKEKEPRFLTFMERELIHKLHKHNPEEWTVEKLSESFPALPETIQRILHAKWSPKSVERVVEYDNVAVQNWEKFRMGKLSLSPALSKHLKKFKDRKIILANRDLLAKQFVPEVEFKKPKSQLFSSIIKTYLNEKQSDVKLLHQEDNSSGMVDKSDHSESQNLLIATNSSAAVTNTERFVLDKQNESLTLQLHADLQQSDESFDKRKEKLLTFDEFVKTKIEDINKESPEEGITLLNVYKSQMDAKQEIQTVEVAMASDYATTYAKEDTSSEMVQKSNKDVTIVRKDQDKNFNIIGADDNLLDTSIKVWNKKVDTELNYAKPIKIAKHLYKPGMTYRISDCYYDDDGEFLYRVPGVHS
ncbi:uncharacterized protein LOC105831947 [Monomorium pharaonis]|uniref:uncharacterized protein LOC105831947 n=1 Tax=Monomorium pharaonis TaxID=307658 RepID=UPI00174619B2|nr:uncharacterized protein LOC105831947 [Monomorium pharaonis]